MDICQKIYHSSLLEQMTVSNKKEIILSISKTKNNLYERRPTRIILWLIQEENNKKEKKKSFGILKVFFFGKTFITQKMMALRISLHFLLDTFIRVKVFFFFFFVFLKLFCVLCVIFALLFRMWWSVYVTFIESCSVKAKLQMLVGRSSCEFYYGI